MVESKSITAKVGREDCSPVFTVICHRYTRVRSLSLCQTVTHPAPRNKTAARMSECVKLHVHEILSALSATEF